MLRVGIVCEFYVLIGKILLSCLAFDSIISKIFSTIISIFFRAAPSYHLERPAWLCRWTPPSFRKGARNMGRAALEGTFVWAFITRPNFVCTLSSDTPFLAFPLRKEKLTFQKEDWKKAAVCNVCKTKFTNITVKHRTTSTDPELVVICEKPKWYTEMIIVCQIFIYEMFWDDYRFIYAYF